MGTFSDTKQTENIAEYKKPTSLRSCPGARGRQLAHVVRCGGVLGGSLNPGVWVCIAYCGVWFVCCIYTMQLFYAAACLLYRKAPSYVQRCVVDVGLVILKF